MAPGADEATYRELFEKNPQPMWVCHRESLRFLAVNDAALQLYGYQAPQFLELSLSSLDPGAGAPRAAAAGTSVVRHRRMDGSFLNLVLRWQPVVFAREPGWLAVLSQPAGEGGALELKAAGLAAQLEAAQRELETFSYSVSHDLRAPLRHIDGFSRALMDDYGGKLDPQGAEYLSRICQAAGKMAGLIDDLQLLARVARSELTRQPVNLSVTAQVIFLELKMKQPGRQAELQVADGVSAEADPRLARQLLEILIGNAWKFSGKEQQSRIEFGTGEREGERLFFVKDNGVGFDPAYADKLFTVFHRLHRADEFEGSGVGLAIAQRIVQRHGGRIWFESAPGQGATFYFTLQEAP